MNICFGSLARICHNGKLPHDLSLWQWPLTGLHQPPNSRRLYDGIGRWAEYRNELASGGFSADSCHSWRPRSNGSAGSPAVDRSETAIGQKRKLIVTFEICDERSWNPVKARKSVALGV